MNEQSIERASRGQFAKGKSANPSGRPKNAKNKPGLISRIMAELGDYSDLEFSLDAIRDGKLVYAQRLRYCLHGEQVLYAFIAYRLVMMAMDGNLEAIKIILDRTEGRIPPPLNLGSQANPSNVQVVFYKPKPKSIDDPRNLPLVEEPEFPC